MLHRPSPLRCGDARPRASSLGYGSGYSLVRVAASADASSSSSGVDAAPAIAPPTVLRPRSKGSPTEVAAVVLGGGENDSRRLYPLTEKRTLPAVPLAGQYRLIDVAMSNCINSNIYKIYILTQYNSSSLNKYLTRTYNLGGGVPVGGAGFMEVVAATQSPDSKRWADGAVDSVRQWLGLLGGGARTRAIHDVLVLPSDQVYRTDFGKLVSFHRETNADITIVCHEVEQSRAANFGLVRLDADSSILEFQEKPQGSDINHMSMDWEDLGDFLEEGGLDLEALLKGDDAPEREERAYIASTGIYMFNREVLEELLSDPKARDFSRQIIPGAIKAGKKVMAYHMDSFWDDVGGSIEDFYNLNIKLACEEVDFDFHESGAPPFYACPTNLPPSALDGVKLQMATVGPGSVIGRSEILESVIGARSIIGSGTTIVRSVIMGADYYEDEKTWPKMVSPTYPHMGIGNNCVIDKAIIDKNVRIGNNCQLVNQECIHESMDRIQQGICIRDGILIAAKSCVIPDGTII